MKCLASNFPEGHYRLKEHGAEWGIAQIVEGCALQRACVSSVFIP